MQTTQKAESLYLHTFVLQTTFYIEFYLHLSPEASSHNGSEKSPVKGSVPEDATKGGPP